MQRFAFVLAGILVSTAPLLAQDGPIEFKDGERIVLLGSTLLERAQRFGYLETEILRLRPDRNITFRTLAWSGDTVYGDSWVVATSHSDHKLRGEQLFTVVAEQKPTSIIVGYGAVEAFDGDKGLERWKTGLGAMLDQLQKIEARLMLLTPPYQEVGKNRAAATYNANLVKYIDVMRDIAAERKIPLIDLAAQMTKYQAGRPEVKLTENGQQFGEAGYRVLAGLFVDALGWQRKPWSATVDAKELQVTGDSTVPGQILRDEERLTFSLKDDALPQPTPTRGEAGSDGPRLLKINGLAAGRYTLYTDGTEVLTAEASEFASGISLTAGSAFERAEALRKAVAEKDRLFFSRWRPENETYLKGFRRREQGRNTIELPIFDPLIARQETEIARLKLPETNYYHLIPAAPASRRGPATIPDTDPMKELATFIVAEGFEVTPFAVDPMVISPTCMNWDSKGRLWVASSQIYPQLKPGEVANDKILILEDLDGDGRADKRTVFAEGLLVPTSVLPGDGGAYVANSSELLHLSDTDGDGRADVTRVVLSGFGTEDTHQILHAFRWAPGGKLHFNQSVLIHSHIETPQGVKRLPGGGIWEYDTRDGNLDVYLRGMVNPWGTQYDRWGQSFATDGAHTEGIYYAWPGAAYFWARGVPKVMKGMNPGQPKECGLEILSGRHIPDAWQGRMLTADFRAHRIVSFDVSENNSGYFSKQTEDLIRSNHEAFRPVDIKMGPDGAIYVCDWYNPIINHGEVDFRDPRRDHQHGRIWRVTAKGRPTLPNPKLSEADVPALLDAMKVPEQWTRDVARQELKYRDRDQIVERLPQWIAALDRNDPDYEHQRLEALWAFETIGAVPPAYLKELLHSTDHRVRAAAVRALSHHRDVNLEIQSLLEESITDVHPRVRLESVNALRALGTVKAFETVLRSIDLSIDPVLDYALWYTIHEMEPVWLPVYDAGKLNLAGSAGRLIHLLVASGKTNTLVDRFAKGELEPEIRSKIPGLIEANGGPAELRVLYDLALAATDPPQRASLMEHLVGAARERRVKPSGNLDKLTELLSRDSAAIKLAGLWKLTAARTSLEEIASSETAAPPLRETALDALVELGGQASIEKLSSLAAGEQPTAIRTRAVAGLTALETKKGAEAAVALLPAIKPEEAGIVFGAFLQKADGPKVLATELSERKLPAEIAAIGIHDASTLGDRAKVLVEALTVAGGAITTRANLPPGEWSALLVDATSRGVAARGEAIYRRSNLGCVKCHAIGGAGGKVGPDLMSLGASAPLDYIAESLVDPSKKIKEGFETTVIVLKSGKVLTGTLVGDTGDHHLLRDANNSVQKIDKRQVDEKFVQTASLMPTGITDPLRREEFVDLVRFLSELGKTPGFQVPTRETVRVWQALQSEAPVAVDQIGKNEIPGANWVPAFSRVGGALPIDETPGVQISDAKKHVVRFGLDVHKAGKISLKLESEGPIEVWLDGRPTTLADRTLTAELATGAHLIVVAAPAGQSAASLRVEKVDRTDSTAQSVFQLEP